MAALFFCLASCVLRSGSDYGTIETASGLCLNSCRLLLWSVEVQNHWICPQGTEVVSVTCRHMKSGLKVSLYLSIFWGEKKCKAGTQLHKCHYSHSSSCHFRPVFHPPACSGWLWGLGNWSSTFRPLYWVSGSSPSETHSKSLDSSARHR